MAGDPPIGKVDLHLSCHQRTDTPDQDLSFTSSWYQLLDHLRSHLPSIQGTVPPYPTVHGISFGKASTSKSARRFWVGDICDGFLGGEGYYLLKPARKVRKLDGWTFTNSRTSFCWQLKRSATVSHLTMVGWWWSVPCTTERPPRKKNVRRCRYMCYKWHLSFVLWWWL